MAIRSNVTVNKLAALECMIELAVKDPYIQKLLNDCLSNEKVSFRSRGETDEILLTRSRQALLSITDTTVNALWAQFNSRVEDNHGKILNVVPFEDEEFAKKMAGFTR